MAPAHLTEAPAVLLLDGEGRILSANAPAAAALGRQPESLRGCLLVTLLTFEFSSDDPAMQAIQWEALRDAATSRPQSISPLSLPRQYHLRLDPVAPEDSSWLGTLVPLPDTAPQAPLPPSNPLHDALSLLANRAAVGFFDLRLDTGELVTSTGWKRMLGYTEHELPDTLATWRRLVHPDDTSAAPDNAPRRHPAGARPFAVEYRLRHRDGRYLWVSCVGVRIFGPEGALQRVSGLHLDITERKELEEISLLNDERLQRLSTQGTLAAFDLDFASRQHWFSAAWHRLLGTSAEGEESALPEPSPLLQALPPDLAGAGLAEFFRPAQAETGEGRRSVELRNSRGEPVPVLLGYQREFNRRGELLRITGYAVPLAGLGAGPGSTPPELVACALGAVAEGVIMTDARGRVVTINAKASALLARSPADAAGKALAEVFALVHRANGSPAEEAVEMALNQTSSPDAPPRLSDLHALAAPAPGGAPRPIVWTAREARDRAGALAGFVIVFRDPEEMRLTPEELIRANRFESLGLLAGGIAHDFNNLLTTILGGVSTAKDNRDFNQLDAAEQACLAAKQLTRQLLTFAKGAGSHASRQVVAPADLLQNAVRIAAAGSPVVVKVETTPDLAPIEVDKGQILQVLQNLVINAIQAMPVPADGRIVVSAENIVLGEREVDELPAGRYLRTDVQDNGSGIPPEILARIFDPFFTTKKTGTGLGLATVDSIVRRHGGRIGVQSTPGIGTLFSVFLPVSTKQLQEKVRSAPAIRFGTGRVLFMDDDPKICELTGAMIASLDYTHDVARNGDEALQLYRRYLNVKRPYDAVLLDLTVIGGMGGEECFKRLRELDPDVRAIVTSGYDDDEIIKRYLEMGFVGYITKPYRVGDLGRVLKSVLGSR
jgi:two-component system, cell cycle sensor histidine kinase and response regulator CckA